MKDIGGGPKLIIPLL